MSDIVDLGFAEDCKPEESWRLGNSFFPSKIGGKPAWLALKGLPGAEALSCEHCREPCLFLCQLYAPYEEVPGELPDDDSPAFHRTIYVFVCPRPECCRPNDAGNVRVLRSQLARCNDYYPAEPPLEEPDSPLDIKTYVQTWSKTCAVCGIHAPKQCARCKRANYCTRSHQVWHWRYGHEAECSNEAGPGSPAAEQSKLSTILFPEYELVKEREEEVVPVASEKLDVQDELEKYEELVRQGKAGTLHSADSHDDEDLLRMASHELDKTFAKFKERIRNEPEQVIRYNRGGVPLFISSVHQPKDIPRCECGSERIFEFQIMPQMLVYLKFKDVLNSLDWGIILIYTCKDYCANETPYMPEYAWKQDIV